MRLNIRMLFSNIEMDFLFGDQIPLKMDELESKQQNI